MLKTAIEALRGTSILTLRRLKSLDINTFEDLLNYFPFRYENFSLVSKINRLQPGETVTLKGQVKEAKNEYTRSRLTLQKIKLQDESGEINITWFNQPYLINIFKRTSWLAVSGAVKIHGHQLVLEPKEYEILLEANQTTIHTGRIIPIYPEKKGLSSRTLREKIYFVLQNHLPEFLPQELLKNYSLADEIYAYRNIHFPESSEVIARARERLSFDELFIINLSSQLTRQDWEKEKVGHKFLIKQKVINSFIQDLSFKLTRDQQKALKAVINDLSSARPMNRLLYGDVGSGKTVVAALAAYITYLNGSKTLFMAPTEILAQQHHQTLRMLFKNSPLKVGLQTGTNKIKNTEDYNLLLGTHALLNQKLILKNVGLVVIDEQHRFGVQQRAMLKEKGINPHLLTMTATPIPRTVALTLYGELDISNIEEMPVGRIPIKTWLVPKYKRLDGYQWIRQKIKEGDQAFVICPLIEESTAETMLSVKAATKEYEYLATKIFSNIKLGLLHGKIKSDEKDKIMKNFKAKKIDILVATPVVEVGIDVPNATIMIIEAAERYGLAQLHQLRGRVGRGEKQSYCLLYTEKEDKRLLGRLNFLAKNGSGLKIAEYDFHRRGPGEIYGSRQHGYLDLKIASLTDLQTIEKSKQAAKHFLADYKLQDFPEIQHRIQKYKRSQISRD